MVQACAMSKGWIGVDLDGTLAYYEPGYGINHVIGAPLMPMVSRVKGWLAEGKDVRILTARMSHPRRENIEYIIKEWCLKHIGQALPCTCVKDFEMVALWDDRAIQMVTNTGLTVMEYITQEVLKS